MREPEENRWMVLVPFDAREGISLSQAAQSTVRSWCVQHGLGRRVGGGVWVVSKVALSMFLDGDWKALAAYLAGDRSSSLVIPYFKQFKLCPDTRAYHTVFALLPMLAARKLVPRIVPVPSTSRNRTITLQKFTVYFEKVRAR